MFVRACVVEKGMERHARVGEGYLGMPRLATVSADAAYTITIPDLLGGAIQFTGLTAGRNFTTPTAADILAAMPDMDIGDTYVFKVSITTAFAGTWVAGTTVTLAGRATTPANTMTEIIVEKTSATAVKWTVL